MKVGIPREVKNHEYRVAITPAGVHEMVHHGHEVFIEKDAGIEFDKWGLPVLDKASFQSTVKNVFFGGDAAFGPKNIIWAVAHGHDAAVSIDRLLNDENIQERPAPGMAMMSARLPGSSTPWSSTPSASAANTVADCSAYAAGMPASTM